MDKYLKYKTKYSIVKGGISLPQPSEDMIIKDIDFYESELEKIDREILDLNSNFDKIKLEFDKMYRLKKEVTDNQIIYLDPNKEKKYAEEKLNSIRSELQLDDELPVISVFGKAISKINTTLSELVTKNQEYTVQFSSAKDKHLFYLDLFISQLNSWRHYSIPIHLSLDERDKQKFRIIIERLLELELKKQTYLKKITEENEIFCSDSVDIHEKTAQISIMFPMYLDFNNTLSSQDMWRKAGTIWLNRKKALTSFLDKVKENI